ncbi:MAG: hypothetical protein R3C15_21115 [Thermoleophilia bacterium]
MKEKLQAVDPRTWTLLLAVATFVAAVAGLAIVWKSQDGIPPEVHEAAIDKVHELEDENGELQAQIDRLVDAYPEGAELASATALRKRQLRSNVRTSFNEELAVPKVAGTAWIDQAATVIGDVEIGRRVYVGPGASIRADEGQPFHIGDESNVQDNVVLHALQTSADGKKVGKNLVMVGEDGYGIYLGDRVSLAAGAVINGPVAIMDDTFVGMRAVVFRSVVGKGVVIEPGAVVLGVRIPDERYVPAGEVVSTQEDADDLPEVTDGYAYHDWNAATVRTHAQLADGYNGRRATEGLVSETPEGAVEAEGSGEETTDGHGSEPVAEEGETSVDEHATEPAESHDESGAPASETDAGHEEPDVALGDEPAAEEHG